MRSALSSPHFSPREASHDVRSHTHATEMKNPDWKYDEKIDIRISATELAVLRSAAKRQKCSASEFMRASAAAAAHAAIHVKPWNPVPDASSGWTSQQQFAYRLRRVLLRAFYAGGRYGAENPAVFDSKGARSLKEIAELPDFIGDEFRTWASTIDFDCFFGLDLDTILKYFPARRP